MLWQAVLTVLAVFAVLLLPFCLLYVRRRWLTGQGGLFDCAFQVKKGNSNAAWVLGVARYRDGALEWYRSFSLSLSPTHVFQRATTAFLHQRSPEALEAIALYDDSIIVSLQDRVSGRVRSLSMASDEALALMSWLESAPPGSHYVSGSAESPC